MTQDKESQKAISEIMHELFDSIGDPAEIADQVDQILFDWILSNDQEIQDWHKERILVLKSIRDIFNKIQKLTPKDA